MKKLSLFAAASLLLLSSHVAVSQSSDAVFEPYSYELVKIKILQPVTEESDGLIEVINSTSRQCSYCDTKLKIDLKTMIEIRSRKVFGSAIELPSHVHKPAHVYIAEPGYVSQISFQQ